MAISLTGACWDTCFDRHPKNWQQSGRTSNRNDRRSKVLMVGFLFIERFRIPFSKDDCLFKTAHSSFRKNINYTPGKLLRDPNGATVFHANISETDASRRCQNMNTYQADARSQERIGSFVNTPCEIEVNEKGMPEITLLEDVNSMPKRKQFFLSKSNVFRVKERHLHSYISRSEGFQIIVKQKKDNRNDFVTISKTRTDRVKATVNGYVIVVKNCTRYQIKHFIKELEPESEGTRSQPVEASVLVKSILSGKLPANICKENSLLLYSISTVLLTFLISQTLKLVKLPVQVFIAALTRGQKWLNGILWVKGLMVLVLVLIVIVGVRAGKVHLVGTDGGGTGLKVNCSAGKETSEEASITVGILIFQDLISEFQVVFVKVRIRSFLNNLVYQSRGGHSYVTPGTSGKKGGIQNGFFEKYEKPDNVNKKDCSVYMLRKSTFNSLKCHQDSSDVLPVFSLGPILFNTS
uniref:C-type lectin domain-containing protein n=1 Tax=Heterorhabditis bacteriophora TaxID=37862 RepID=A0A1I7WEH5_HETBA